MSLCLYTLFMESSDHTLFVTHVLSSISVRLIFSSRVSEYSIQHFWRKRNEYLHLPLALDIHKTCLPHWKKGREKGLKREDILLNLLTLLLQTFHKHLIYKIKGKTKSIYRPVTTGWPPLSFCYWPPFSAGDPTAEMWAGITALDRSLSKAIGGWKIRLIA